jgi:sugar lactone lactonase YvrE
VEYGAISFWDINHELLQTMYLSGVGYASRLVMLPATVTTLVSGLTMPTGVTVDGIGHVYVTDGETYTVTEYSQSAGAVSSAGPLAVNAVNAPVGMAVDGAGNLFVASSGNDRVIRMAWNGATFTDQQNVGSGLYVPSGVAVGADGSMCVANTYENEVNCYNWTDTSYIRKPLGFNYAAGGSFVAHFPLSTAIDVAGNVFWVQSYQNGVTEFNNGKSWVSNLWQGYFQYPTAVALDGEGDLYVLDSGHNRVMMMVPVNGVYQKPVLVAAGFNAPQGLAVDAEGNLYVADTGNHRVVKLVMTQGAPLVFTPTTSGGNSTQTMEVLSVGAQTATITGVSYPQDFQAGTSSTAESCSAGVALEQGQSCTVSAMFAPQQANAQFQESIVIAAQGASGGVMSYAVAVQGTSASTSSQTIQFAAQAPEIYGQGMVAGHTSFPLDAKSSSGLPVTFAVVSGPGAISGGNTLVAMGVGTIVVRASQVGNSEYAAANSVEQSFTVLPATLTVTASNQQVVYGATPSSFGYTITGFVGGDTGSVVSGNPTITSSAGTHPAVGSYAIQIQAGTLAAANYTFVFAQGTLTVTPARLTLLSNSTEMMMGSAVPALSYSAVGLVGADTLASATTGAPVLSTTATPQSLPGSYAILISAGTLQAKNYVIAYQSGVLQVILLNSHGYNPPGGLTPPPFRLHGVPVLPFVGAGVVAENHSPGSRARWQTSESGANQGAGWKRMEDGWWGARQDGNSIMLPGMPAGLAAGPLWSVGVSESSACAQKPRTAGDQSQSADGSRDGSGVEDYCAASAAAAPAAIEER